MSISVPEYYIEATEEVSVTFPFRFIKVYGKLPLPARTGVDQLFTINIIKNTKCLAKPFGQYNECFPNRRVIVSAPN